MTHHERDRQKTQASREYATALEILVEGLKGRIKTLEELTGLQSAEIKTLKSYVVDRDEQLRRYEAATTWAKTREEAGQ